MMTVHIVNPFASAWGGTELSALELWRALSARCEAVLWSTQAPGASLAGHPIRRIGVDGEPQGGTLVVAGNFFPLGGWLRSARPSRTILLYNTVVRQDLKYAAIETLRSLRDPEIVYETRLVRDWVGLPGRVYTSRIDLQRFRPATRAANDRFVVGRHSRDEVLKHHPGDVGLYRRLAATGATVRVMGGESLAPRVGFVPGVDLLAEGAQPAEAFLAGLDVFLYRTSPRWTEAGGRVVKEAMACGLPVVGHRNGGYAEWIEHGRNGFIFDRDDEALELVLALKDPPLRQRIGAAARSSMEAMFSPEATREFVDFFVGPSRPAPGKARRIEFCWELGGGTGHVTTLLPIARAMRARGHDVRFLLRDAKAGADLEGSAEIPREPAPVWVGPLVEENRNNFGEILRNFGYHDAAPLKQLVDAWRERLWLSGAVVANVAPAAHLAARTLGIPSFEISQGFHIPPATLPAPPLRDWEPVSRERLEAADRQVVGAMNAVLAAYGVPPLASIGELFAGRAMLLTYPELDIYPQRGAADYYGITDTGEGSAVPAWPAGDGPKTFAYLYHYYKDLGPLLESLQRLRFPALVFCRGIDPALAARHREGCVRLVDEPMSVSRVLPQCDLVVCHASHQMTAQALLAGKPLLMASTQLEQFLILRRVVRYGAGLGMAPDFAHPDFAAALRELRANPAYAAKAREFAVRYAGHDRKAALATMTGRIEAALR